MKLACILVFFLVLVTVINADTKNHSISWGVRSFRDTLLDRVIITEKSRLWRIVTRDYEYKPKVQNFRRTITQIVVIDQVKDGKGGYAQLVSGGPHATYAKLHFKSQRGNGFSFIVDIYGI